MKKYAIYTVCEISEDMDFGCEERQADVQRMAVVMLTDQNGEKIQVKQLYEREIEKGDSVYLDSEGRLQKFHIIEEIENNLRRMADEKNAEFQRKLTPGIALERFLGTRVPALRPYAKKLAKQSPDGCAVFLYTLPQPYYDEDILHAILLSQIKEFDSCLTGVSEFLPYINNWATCDLPAPKCFEEYREELLPVIREWLLTTDTYTIRYGIGILMRLYLDDAYRPEYADLVARVRSEEYYANMMIAWYFATALAKQCDTVIPYLEERKLYRWVHQKTIQKAVESFRITPEQKVYLKSLRYSKK